jgi:hypothetical protein
MIKRHKPPKPEPTLIDQLSAPLRDFVSDFKTHGAKTLELVRERSPEKYIELSAKLIALIAALKTEPDGFHNANSMEEIGRLLLKSVGCQEDLMTDNIVQAAIEENDIFIAKLEQIRAKAEGEIH